MTDQRELSIWLDRLGWALGNLTPVERDEIVRETRSHIEERLALGGSLQQVLRDFGPAERHARQFVDEVEAYEALGSQRAGLMARFIFNRAHRNFAAAGALLLLLLLGTLGGIALMMVGLEILDPAHTGLWVGGGAVFLGILDEPVGARELLGLWLFPVAALVLTLAAIGGRFVLSWIVELLAPRSDRSSSGEL